MIRQATWASIYAGAFGSSGQAGCATGSTCHGAAAQSGVVVSNFLCANKDDCNAALTGGAKLVTAADTADPGNAPLLRQLRQAGGKGRMPLGNAFVFQPEDIARIKAWIGAGAKND